MKNNIYFFLALLSVVKIFCMDKAEQAAPVVVASNYYADGSQKGEGHRIVAQVRLMRSLSVGKLGDSHQQTVGLDVFDFDLIAAENGEATIKNCANGTSKDLPSKSARKKSRLSIEITDASAEEESDGGVTSNASASGSPIPTTLKKKLLANAKPE